MASSALAMACDETPRRRALSWFTSTRTTRDGSFQSKMLLSTAAFSLTTSATCWA